MPLPGNSINEWMTLAAVVRTAVKTQSRHERIEVRDSWRRDGRRLRGYLSEDSRTQPSRSRQRWNEASSSTEITGSALLNLSVQRKDLPVGFDWIALGLPGCQSTLEELDPVEIHSQSSSQNCPAGVITGTSTINDCVFFFRDQ